MSWYIVTEVICLFIQKDKVNKSMIQNEEFCSPNIELEK